MKNNLSLIWGIIAGTGTVLLLICFYLINKALLFDTFVYYGSLLVTGFLYVDCWKQTTAKPGDKFFPLT